MAAIDHKAQAEEFAERGFQASSADHETRCLKQAQVHALLYLGEQQRLANQIAFARDLTRIVGLDDWSPEQAADLTRKARELGDLIHEGLGLL